MEDKEFISTEINKLLRIDDTVNQIAQHTVFSTVDLKSAYHQVPIEEKEKKYTAFEANSRLTIDICKLYELHKSLCPPSVARMAHFVKSRNLPISVEDVKRMSQACKECQECKKQHNLLKD